MKTLLYPWQMEQWQRLQLAKTENRLPHALMLTGMAGIGKRVFADALVRSLLCEQSNVLTVDHDCQCHACHLVTGRSHPDAMWVEPEKVGQAIKVDQVREVNHFIQQSSMGAMNRVVVIYPADAMNINAANALLKTLEEPSNHAFIVLICDQVGRLPATILSRCQRVHFARPLKEVAMQWLQQTSIQAGQQADLLLRLAQGAPCAALTLAAEDGLVMRQQIIHQLSGLANGLLDPLQVATNIKEADYLYFIDIFMLWLLDVIKLQLGADSNHVVNIDNVSELQWLKEKSDINHHLRTVTALQQLQQSAQKGLNLNKKLMMEQVLIRWSAEVRV